MPNKRPKIENKTHRISHLSQSSSTCYSIYIDVCVCVCKQYEATLAVAIETTAINDNVRSNQVHEKGNGLTSCKDNKWKETNALNLYINRSQHSRKL